MTRVCMFVFRQNAQPLSSGLSAEQGHLALLSVTLWQLDPLRLATEQT